MNPQEPQAIQIARLGFRQAIVVAAITAVAAIAVALIQTGRLHSRDEQIKKSDARVQDLQGQLAIASMSTEEKAALYRLTADHLESDLNLTAGKGSLEAGSSALPEAELNYRRLRHAVFFNLTTLQGNRAILEGTLAQLAARGRPWVAPAKDRLVAGFPDLKALRLRWLQDAAIPALQRAIAQRSPMQQSLPSATVTLPHEVWILDHAAGSEPTATVSSLNDMNEEVELLKRTL
jgi:hypothetical protein